MNITLKLVEVLTNILFTIGFFIIIFVLPIKAIYKSYKQNKAEKDRLAWYNAETERMKAEAAAKAANAGAGEDQPD